MLGVLAAADQANRQGVKRISVIEFGVAGGNGLLELERVSALVEKELEVHIHVVGFDMGSQGLPMFVGDHRDHPDIWKKGDFPMDIDSLLKKISPRTTLIIGNVKTSIEEYIGVHNESPIGFVSFDMDLYSSTTDALRLFTDQRVSTLYHVPAYFDDIESMFNYKDAGELRAINEFNETNRDRICIDRWYGVKEGRPFPERGFLDRMYVIHNCESISKASLERGVVKLSLS
jgi:hypothetical protein